MSISVVNCYFLRVKNWERKKGKKGVGGKHSLSCISWGFWLERIIRALAGKEVYWQKVKLNLLKNCIKGFFVILP